MKPSCLNPNRCISLRRMPVRFHLLALAAALVLAALPGICPAQATQAANDTASPGHGDYQDGIYQDLAPGYGDEVIVTVTVRQGRIVSLDAKNRNGNESEYFWKARDGMAAAILQAQTYEGVEAVSGATGTSTSILAAMEGMMEQLRYNGLPHNSPAGESSQST